MTQPEFAQCSPITISGVLKENDAAYTPHKLVAQITNTNSGNKLTFDSFTGDSPRITISTNTFTFTLSADETKMMCGPNIIEVGIVDSDNKPILPIGAPIKFYICPSGIGQYILKNILQA